MREHFEVLREHVSGSANRVNLSPEVVNLVWGAVNLSPEVLNLVWRTVNLSPEVLNLV